jgi:hypothetical protein
MGMALNFASHPEFGPAIRKLDTLREIYRAHMLPPERFVLSEAEFEAERKRIMAAMAPQDDGEGDIAAKRLDLDERRLEAEIQIANLDAHTRLKEAEMRLQVARINQAARSSEAAERLNLEADKTEAAERTERARLRSKERVVATETAMASRLGKGGGGHI